MATASKARRRKALRAGTPTPRMLGGRLSNLQRISRKTMTVPFDTGRSVTFRLTYFYTKSDSPRGEYKGVSCDAFVTNHGTEGVPITMDSWLSDVDIQSCRNLAAVEQVQRISFKKEGVKFLLQGYQRHGHNGRPYWATGLLDQLGVQLGVLSGSMQVAYPDRAACYAARKELLSRTHMSTLLRWKRFRGECMRQVVGRSGKQLLAELDRLEQSTDGSTQPAAVGRRNRGASSKVLFYVRKVGRLRGKGGKAAATKKAKVGRPAKAASTQQTNNTTTELTTLHRMLLNAAADGPVTVSNMSEHARGAGHKTTYSHIQDEIRQQLARPAVAELFTVDKSAKPFKYTLSEKGRRARAKYTG